MAGVVLLGAGPRPHGRPVRRRPGPDHDPAGVGHRPGDRGLLRLVLRTERHRRPDRRAARALRRRHARPRHRRARGHPLPVLGADLDPVVAADRPAPHRSRRPGRRHPRPRPHRRRRARAPRWPGRARPRGRHVVRRRAARRSAGRDRRRRRARLRRPRHRHEVRPVPVPCLAAGRHGRPDPGERVPPLGHDGEGGHLPRRAPGPGLQRPRRVAAGDPDHRARHDDRRRPARHPPGGPQAAAGVRHGEPARLPLRARGHRLRGRDHRRHHPARGPRPVQGHAVPRRRHRRPPGPHPGPHPPAGPEDGIRLGAPANLRRPHRRIDGRGPAARRLHREGGGLRRVPPPRRRGRRHRHRRHRDRLGADDGVQPPLRLGVLAPRATGTTPTCTRHHERSPLPSTSSRS